MLMLVVGNVGVGYRIGCSGDDLFCDTAGEIVESLFG